MDVKLKIHFLARMTICFCLIAGCLTVRGQDTFSIVAVDTLTGEIGSAGASCVGPVNGVGAFILSDVIEGVGAIHTQAFWSRVNQQNAHARMLEGLSPQEIIDWLITNDVNSDPTIRQYGIVDLTRGGESAAYTGVNCWAYRDHVTGPGYAVQGNILLGQVILDTMQHTFLNTPGTLADRLMKALEAAKIIGADTRCAVRNTSSQSAFIKVVRIGDGGTPYLQEIVPDSPVGVDPIGLLREQFDLWKQNLANTVDPFLSQAVFNTDSLPANGTAEALLTVVPKNNADTLLAPGLEILLANSGEGSWGPVSDLGNGTYVASLSAPATAGSDTVSVRVVDGPDTVALAARPILRYVPATGLPGQTGVERPAPGDFRLYPNFPNPFNPGTVISYQLSVVSEVDLSVYNLLGEKVVILVTERQPAGHYRLTWNGRDEGGALMPSGVYFAQLRVNGGVRTVRMVLAR